MKKSLHTYIKIYVLLTLYVFSTIGILFFHQHSNHLQTINHITACQKKIYDINSFNDDCHHASHYSEQEEDCTFCHTQIFTAHLVQKFSNHFVLNTLIVKFNGFYSKCIYKYFASPFNKGPPLV